MFAHIRDTYNLFREGDLSDPLNEAIRFFSLLSGGCLQIISPHDIHDIDLREVIDKRKKGVPMEYIVGRAVFHFYGRCWIRVINTGVIGIEQTILDVVRTRWTPTSMEI